MRQLTIIAALLAGLAVPWASASWAQQPGESVTGLRFTLSADKEELKATRLENADGELTGWAIEPTRLSLTFVNTGRTRLKLIAHDLDWALVKFVVTGPDAGSVKALAKELAHVAPEPKDKDFPTIDPSRGWTAKWRPLFPGALGPATYKLLKPGEYRIAATYSCDEGRLHLHEMADGSWIGTVKSNVLVLKVVVPGQEAPRGVPPAEAEAANGLKLTLSSDKASAKMTPRSLRALADGAPRQDTEPVTFTLTFANVSDKPIKLDACGMMSRRVELFIKGPNDQSVLRAPNEAKPRIEAAQDKDFPVIEPGKSWTHEFTAAFPFDAGAATFALQEAGEYRFRAVYSYAAGPAAGEKTAAAAGAWTGSVTSNELVVNYGGEGSGALRPAPEGLKIVLESDKKEVVLKAAAGARGAVTYSVVEPAKLSLSLQNAGDKPVKVCMHGFMTRLVSLSVKGPDADSVRETKAAGGSGTRAPAQDDYPTLEPFAAWAVEGQVQFPGAFADTTFAILKPGEYRLSLTYIVEPADLKRSPLADGCWTGKLTSEEIVIKAVVATGK